ncbi:acyltransferase family protein [Sphingomonas sp. S2-65]|uniref:acyltransferase family protein n=1 Tax=Sphingomonas sp. S2-65 TaxID=2903960 RepID=UPI001F17FD32|nr:acyltransferase family protein [Sphingomonas sp. S2-65]UYY57099.1 acyltransferase family protein [Sphingomonas sp. S2-65]
MSERERSENRVEWIDALRGVGIIFVVAGHVFSAPAAHHVIFLFHMPLFFFLSGFLFRPEPFRVLAKKRVRSLLIPYVAFLLLVTALDLVAFKFDNIHTLPLHPYSRFFGSLAFGGSLLTGSQGVAWFVPCLFLTTLAYAAAEQACGGPLKPATIAVVVALYLLSFLLPAGPSPLGSGQVPQALAFFWAGRAAQPAAWPGRGWAVGLAVFLAAAAFVPAIDMKYMQFGWPVVSALVALGAIAALTRAAQALASRQAINRAASALGRAALVIMFLHLFFVVHLRHVAPEPLIFILGLLAPFLAYLLLSKFEAGRFIFLGKSGGIGPTLKKPD